MATAAIATETTRWIALATAARILGVSPPTVEALVEEGRLSVREVPGSYPKVPEHEVRELAEACTRPRSTELATASA